MKREGVVAIMVDEVRSMTRDIAPAESPFRTTWEALPPNWGCVRKRTVEKWRLMRG
jgi:hypothetical protein